MIVGANSSAAVICVVGNFELKNNGVSKAADIFEGLNVRPRLAGTVIWERGCIVLASCEVVFSSPGYSRSGFVVFKVCEIPSTREDICTFGVIRCNACGSSKVEVIGSKSERLNAFVDKEDSFILISEPTISVLHFIQ